MKRIFRECCLFVLCGFVLGGFVVPADAQQVVVNDETLGLTSIQGKHSGRNHIVYVDGAPGTDITDAFQQAIDRVCQNGGTVVLPSGTYQLSRSINCAGSPERFGHVKGGVKGLTIEGNGAILLWVGPDEGAVIDLPGPTDCQIMNLTVAGQRETGWRKVIGLRYRGGLERRTHGGKNNLFEHLKFQNLGVGIEVGGLFGPDLVGGTFVSLQVHYVRIGVRLMGPNVTSMVFFNPIVAGFEETGFEVKAFAARRIRASPDDTVPEVEVHGEPTVLMDPDNEKEIFQKDLPEWMVQPNIKYPVWWGEHRGSDKNTLWAGGGGLDVTIYGLLGHSSHLNSWMFDTNWGQFRVYTARIEGMGGILRSRTSMPAGRFANMLIDVNATSAGGVNGNAIELNGECPTYMMGGTYRANIALGSNTRLFNYGVRFDVVDRNYSALLPLDYDGPLNDRVEVTDKQKTLPNIRGKARIVKVKSMKDVGFVQLPNTSGGTLIESTQAVRVSADVSVGTRTKKVNLEGLQRLPSNDYHVSITPNYDAGSIWVARKAHDHVLVRMSKPAPKDARIDVRIEHAAWRGEAK